MKKRIAALMAAAAFASNGVAAFAQGTFLCMRSEESVAITIDEKNNFKYIDMKDSNGTTVYPQISTDGNTYLPFRYVCEMAGLKDAAGIEGNLPDGHFRYWAADPDIPGDKQKIEIMFNGNYYCHNIGERFTYELRPGDVRSVSIYNIRGSLYFPMSYMAKITDSTALWADGTKRIIYISNNLNSWDYLNDRNDLRRDKLTYMGFDYFCNNLGNSPLYLKSDGVTIQNLSDEIPGNPKTRCITRSGRQIYFIGTDKQVYTKIEDIEGVSTVSFMDKSGYPVDVLADNVIVVQNKLYGVKVNSSGEIYGRLFRSNLDGTDFEYMNDKTVYNLMMRKRGEDVYLFYCDAGTRQTIHMIELKTMDDYELQITDFKHNNLLYDIKQFVMGDKMVAYISNDNKLHVIDLVDNIEDYEILRLSESKHKIFLQGSDGESLSNITSMNYEYINNILYVTQVDYTGRTYYYTRTSGNFNRLEKSEQSITDVALFNDANYNDYCAKLVNGQAQVNKVVYSNDRLSIVE